MHVDRLRLARVLSPLALALALVLAPGAAQARGHERLRITVGGADFKPYPVAVPAVLAPGAGPAAAKLQAEAQAVTDLLRMDVALARSFSLVPQATYIAPTAGNAAAAVPYDAWSSVGASGLVRGSVTALGTRVRVDLHFDDVLGRRELLARTCDAEVGGTGRCVHQFLDAVLQQLTGEPGIFSSRIAFVRRAAGVKAIYAADVDGGAQARMVLSGHLSLLPAWDSVGRALYFTSYVGGGAHMYRLLTGSGRTEAVSSRRGLNVGAAPSPDGKKVALTLSQDGDAEIYVMDADGRNLTRLTRSLGQDVSPSWSPDSRRIAFVSSRSGAPHIYVMNADGSAQRRLTYRGNYNQEPDWSPRADGQIAFTARDETLHFDLFLVHPDTGAVTRLTQDAADNMSPSFAPDGHHLAFTSSRGPSKRQELYVMDVEGRDITAILPGVTDVETPAWGPRLGY